MLPADELPVLREDDDLADAFEEINETDRAFGVVLRDGRVVGVLSFADVRRVFTESTPSSGGRPVKRPAGADR
jgi:CBS domain-containing protein